MLTSPAGAAQAGGWEPGRVPAGMVEERDDVLEAQFDDVGHFRATAEEMRVAAENMSGEDCKEAALRIAKDYDRLADWAERRTSDKTQGGLKPCVAP
jgi:chromosome condensin MukBEF MukE localization factor